MSFSMRQSDQSISGEQSARGGRKKGSSRHLRDESLDPVFSIKGGKQSLRGEQSARAGRKNTSFRVNDEESVDPVFSIRGPESTRSEWSEASNNLIGKSIRIKEDKRKDGRKPINPLYGARGSQKSLVSTIREQSPTSTSTYFRDENDRPSVGYLAKYRKLFGVGILLFFIVDAILIAVFFSPLKKVKGSTSSDAAESSQQNPNKLFPNDTLNDAPPLPTSNTDDETSTQPPTFFGSSTTSIDSEGITKTKIGRFEVLDVVPHDPEASTQGLEVLSYDKIELMKEQFNGASVSTRPRSLQSSYLLESTGQYGDSSLRITDLASGYVEVEFFMNENYFGKGCTYFYDHPDGADKSEKIRIVQLTWDEGSGFVYDLIMPTDDEPEWSFMPMGDFQFSDHTTNGKGRGIVYHPLRKQFIVSDGSSYLHFWELTDESTFTFYTDTDYITTFEFRLVEKVRVREASGSSSEWTEFRNLNDLAWDPYSYGGNTILANIGLENKVVRIWVGDPGEGTDDDDNTIVLSESFTRGEDVGKITHIYDLSEMEEESSMNAIAFAYESSANGLAEDSSEDEFWITGSNWPSIYRVRLIDE